MKKKAVKIKLTRAEGPHHLCGVVQEFEGDDCWRSASRWLWSQAYTFPKSGGYDKHDFVVTFEDGETYEGRLDCKSDLCGDSDINIAKHMSEFLGFLAGTRRPAHMSESDYRRYLGEVGGEDVDKAKAFLAEYEIPPV